MSRKAESLPITMIIVAIIVLVTAFIVIMGFKSLFGKGLTGLGENQDKAKDSDKDGVIDFFDDCKCMKGLDSNNGCPPSQKTPINTGNDCIKDDKK